VYIYIYIYIYIFKIFVDELCAMFAMFQNLFVWLSD